MDKEVKRMLADLGVNRRDVISAPSADARGHAIKEDPRVVALIRREEATRKKKLADAEASEHQTAQAITRWNSLNDATNISKETAFEDRFGGQAHRALLTARQHQPTDLWDAVDARVGEERRLYLQQKGSSPQSQPLKLAQPKAGQQYISKQSHVPAQDRGRVQQSKTLAQKRAISPRAFGTVRFPPASKSKHDNSSQMPAPVAAMHQKTNDVVPKTQAKPQITSHSKAANSKPDISTSVRQHQAANNPSKEQLPAPNPKEIPIQKPVKNVKQAEHSRKISLGRVHGTLSASFFSSAGEFMGIHQMAVAAPIHATMSIFSLAPQYNARDLIDALQHMVHYISLNRSNYSSNSRGLNGVVLSPGGIWDDAPFDTELLQLCEQVS